MRNWESSSFIILVVVDGVRLSDTGNSPSGLTFDRIPWQRDMAASNNAHIMLINNAGETLTVPGHMAYAYGVHGNYSNDGSQICTSPSFVKLLCQNQENVHGAFICSKGKLQNALSPPIHLLHNIKANCGPSGKGSQYNRDDKKTVEYVLEEIRDHVLEKRRRTVCMVNLHEPDTNAHKGNIRAYEQSITRSDGFIADIYHELKKNGISDAVILVSSDHGRHDNDVTSHGCSCDGCRNMYLFVYGPNVRGGINLSEPKFDQTSVFSTIVKNAGNGREQISHNEQIKSLFVNY